MSRNNVQVLNKLCYRLFSEVSKDAGIQFTVYSAVFIGFVELSSISLYKNTRKAFKLMLAINFWNGFSDCCVSFQHQYKTSHLSLCNISYVRNSAIQYKSPGILCRLIRVGGLMLPSKRPLYMENILNVAPKIGNIYPPTLIMSYFLFDTLRYGVYLSPNIECSPYPIFQI